MPILNNINYADEIERILESSQSGQAEHVIAALLDIGKEMTPEEGELLIENNPGLLEFQGIASRLYETYIINSENREAGKILDKTTDNGSGLVQCFSQFGKNSYDRVCDMFQHVDFAMCERFVLVGCGCLPATMFHVYDQTQVPSIIGMDNRPDAIDILDSIVDKYHLDRIQTVLGYGQEFDYSGTDIVYIANLASPKKQILDQIVETASSKVQIIMRDPCSIGRLWTEPGIDKLDYQYQVVAYGKTSPAYFSRDVVLRLRENARTTHEQDTA